MSGPEQSVGVVCFAGGDQRWRAAQDRLLRQLVRVPFISHISAFGEDDLSALSRDFPAASRLIGPEQRGFGFWLWKPLAIRHYLQSRLGSEGVVLYLDVGCELNTNPYALRRLRDRADQAARWGMCAEQMTTPEALWTKRDLLIRLSVESDDLVAGQMSATWILMRNDRSSIAFVDEWIHLALEDSFRFLDDSPSRVAETEGFIEHRHDQSIFSLLYKRQGYPSIPSDGEWLGVGGAWRGADRPIWTIRNGSNVSRLPGSVKHPSVGWAAMAANGARDQVRRLRF